MALFRAGVVLAALLVCGCAPATIAPEHIQGIRRVAVISAIGDKFIVKKIGFTVFGNDEKELPIEAWRIDDFVAGKVRSVLAGRFEVRPVAAPPSAFADNITAVKIVETARGQAGAADVDAYVVVTKRGSPYASTNQFLSGLGILDHSALGTKVWVYALYEMTVVDGHNLSVVASTPAFPLSQMMLSLESIHGPSREVDESWMPATLDAAQNMRLKSAITELLDRNLPGTIANLKLLQ